jgi:hypothetical protein
MGSPARAAFASTPPPKKQLENGYDHNFVLRGGGAADE